MSELAVSRSASVSLQPLLEFASRDRQCLAMHGKSAAGRNFGRLVTKLVDGITPDQGFYLWGYFESSGLWRSVYIGKSGTGKVASLRARISEELRDERAFIWVGKHTGHDAAACKRMWQQYYPSMITSSAPDNHIERALRKAGTTHIIWAQVSNLQHEDVLQVEAELIEIMNPAANVHRPTPKPHLIGITLQVIESFEHKVHELRSHH